MEYRIWSTYSENSHNSHLHVQNVHYVNILFSDLLDFTKAQPTENNLIYTYVYFTIHSSEACLFWNAHFH